MLRVELRVTKRHADGLQWHEIPGQLDIVRLSKLEDGKDEYEYSWNLVDPTGRASSGQVTHKYSQGAWALVQRVLSQIVGGPT